MKKDQKLLAQDNDRLAAILRDLKQFEPLLVEFQECYESLNIGNFSNQTWQEMKSFGIENQRERWLLKNDVQLPNLEAKALFAPLKLRLNEMKAFQPKVYGNRPALTIQYISYIDGEFAISDEDKEQILDDHCRIYLQPGDETDLYFALVMVLESRKEFIKIARRLEILDANERSASTLDRFFISDGEELTIKISALRPAVEFRERKKRIEASRKR